MEEYVPDERTGQNHSKRGKQNGDNIPDREFKVMVIKILTGLEKRGEDFSESLNKEKEDITEPVRS